MVFLPTLVKNENDQESTLSVIKKGSWNMATNQHQQNGQPQSVQPVTLLNSDTLYNLFHGHPVLQAEAEYVLASLNLLHGTNYTVENLNIVIQPAITRQEIDDTLGKINRLRIEMGQLGQGPEHAQRHKAMQQLYFWLLERGVTLDFD